MGASIATQTAKQIINNSIAIGTNASQTCQSTTVNNFNVTATDKCVQDLSGLSEDNKISIDTRCIQNTTVQNNLQAQLQTQIMNDSLAAAQSLGGPSLNVSTQIQQFAQKTSIDIKNLFTQSCVTAHSSDVTIACSGNAQQTIKGINVSNQISDYQNCTTNNSVITQAVVTLSNILQNTNAAKESDTLIDIVIIIVVIIGIFGVFFVQSLNGPIGWVVVIIIAAVIIGLIIYAIYAFEAGLYPFNSKS